jgi:hypothetical protein
LGVETLDEGALRTLLAAVEAPLDEAAGRLAFGEDASG